MLSKAGQQRIKSAVTNERIVVVNKRWFTPPALVLFGYVLLFWLTLLFEVSAARLMLATLLALLASGYSLVAVLFPEEANLDLVERMALSATLSLAIGGVSGYILARSPWTLHMASFLVVTVLFNLGCYLYLYHHGTDEEMLLSLNLPQSWIEQWGNQSDPSKGLTLALLLLFAAGGIAIRHNALAPYPDPPMTEFFLLDSQGRAKDYPTVVEAGEPLEVPYGIMNREENKELYSVHALSEGKVIANSIPITLAPGDYGADTLTVSLPEQMVGAAKIEFVLYKGSNAERYRVLHLWVTTDAEAEQ